MPDRKEKDLRPGSSSNGQNASTGNGGERRNGRLSQFKNHSVHGDDTPDEFISCRDQE